MLLEDVLKVLFSFGSAFIGLYLLNKASKKADSLFEIVFSILLILFGMCFYTETINLFAVPILGYLVPTIMILLVIRYLLNVLFKKNI